MTQPPGRGLLFELAILLGPEQETINRQTGRHSCAIAAARTIKLHIAVPHERNIALSDLERAYAALTGSELHPRFTLAARYLTTFLRQC
jgi:hypothetical protein